MRRARSLPEAATAAAVLVFAVLTPVAAPSQPVPRRQAVEIPVPPDGSDAAVLGRPLAMAFEGGRLYVADAADCAIKVFSRDGVFIASFGRQGQGPGELSFPSGVAASGGTIAVADKFNFRIQLLDVQGAPRGGFRVPFAPDRVFALDGGRLLVTANPTGRRSAERLLHIFDQDGRPVWSGLDALTSSDPVMDALRNMVLVCPRGTVGFYVVFRTGERTILRFSAAGDLVERIEVDGRYAFRTLDLPSGRGPARLVGFCWAAAFDRDRLYLSQPEAVAGPDLGPGRTVSVVDERGRLQDSIGLPCRVARLLAADGRLFAIDDEGALRIFEAGR